MFERTPQQSSLIADDGYLTLLSRSITPLRELIVLLVEQDKDTRCLSELLCVMLREYTGARRIRGDGPAAGTPLATAATVLAAACRPPHELSALCCPSPARPA